MTDDDVTPSQKQSMKCWIEHTACPSVVFNAF